MFAMESAHDADIQGGTLLTAFPTAGMVRTIAIGYIAKFLKMQWVAIRPFGRHTTSGDRPGGRS